MSAYRKRQRRGSNELAAEENDSQESKEIQMAGGAQAIPAGATAIISLDGYGDSAYLTKPEMCCAFNCSERTLRRMIERFELPPGMTLAGRKVWIAGKLRAWLSAAAERKEAEALKVAHRVRAFDT